MSTQATPTFSEQNVVPAATLARGATARGTVELTSKFGMYLLVRIGRTDTTALGTAISVQIRRVYGGASGARIHPGSALNRTSSTAAAGASTTVSADSAAGQAILTVASGAGISAGDLLKIQDSGGGVTRLEFQRVSKVSGGTITLDDNLQYTHTAAQADTVVNGADVFAPIWCPGGCLWEVVFDYGAAASGSSVTVEAVAQVYASDFTS
jgi:hypothetical protein